MDTIIKIKELFGWKIAKISGYIIIIFLSIYYYQRIIDIGCIIFRRLINNPFSLIVILLLIIKSVLFKKSNEISNNEMQEYYDDHKKNQKTHKSDRFMGVNIVLTERSIKNKNEIVIKVVNNSDMMLQYIKGKVNLYESGEEAIICRISDISFEYTKLYKNTEGIVKIVPLSQENRLWTSFDVYLEEISFEDGEQKSNIKVRGDCFLRNTFWILSYLNKYDNKIWGFKIKYNLRWLKSKVNDIKSMVSFNWSQHVIIDYNPSQTYLKDFKKDRRRKWLFRIIVISCNCTFYDSSNFIIGTIY